MVTTRSRGIDRYASLWWLGSVRRIMIESEWLSVTRWSVFAKSRPSIRMVVGFEISAPFCGASTRSTPGDVFCRRSLAFATLLRNER